MFLDFLLENPSFIWNMYSYLEKTNMLYITHPKIKEQTIMVKVKKLEEEISKNNLSKNGGILIGFMQICFELLLLNMPEQNLKICIILIIKSVLFPK